MRENLPSTFVCVQGCIFLCLHTCSTVSSVVVHTCAHSHILHLFVCVGRGNGEEESAPVCDLPGADSQADQQCCVRDMCRAVQPQRAGEV